MPQGRARASANATRAMPVTRFATAMNHLAQGFLTAPTVVFLLALGLFAGSPSVQAQSAPEVQSADPQEAPPTQDANGKQPRDQGAREQESGEEKPAVKEAPVFRDLLPTEALAVARTEKKMSVIICLSLNEAPSKKFDSVTLADPKVRDWIAKNAVAIRLLSEAGTPGSDYVIRKAIKGLPVMELRAPSGQALETAIGHQGPQEFLRLLVNMNKAITTTSKPTGELANDPYSWLAYANYSAGRGMQPEVTAEALLWCWDHADKHDPEFIAKNHEFILRRLTHVMNFSEAVEAEVRARRSRIEKLVRSAQASEFQAYLFSRMGIWMNDQDAAISTFLTLKPSQAPDADNSHLLALREVLLWNNLERLVAFRHYKAVLEACPDPQKAIGARIVASALALKKDIVVQADPDMPRPPGVTPVGNTEKSRHGEEAGQARSATLPKVSPARSIPGVDLSPENISFDAALLYESLLATGAEAQAKALMEMVTAHYPTGQTIGDFIERSCRLEKWFIAEEVALHGFEIVPEKDIEVIQRKLRRNLRRKPQ